MKTPEYVRLPERLVHGMMADTISGFSIAGYDVVPFPEDPEQARYAKRQLNAGNLEPAIEAEYEEAHPEAFEDEDDDEREAARMVEVVRAAAGKKDGPMQEHKFRQRIEGRQAAVQSKRREVDADDDEFDGSVDARRARRSQQRRERVLEVQRDEIESDDPEEQEERTATRAPAGTPKASKKASKAKKAAKKDDENTE